MKWELLLRVAAQVCLWGVVALCFGESFRFGCLDMYERFSNEVDTWSPGRTPQRIAPLDNRFEKLDSTRLADGRLFVRAQTEVETAVFYEWEPQKARFVKATWLPSIVPAGVDGTSAFCYPTTSGRVLVVPGAPEPARLYDHGVATQVPRPSFADGRTNYPGAVVRPIELSDGALLMLAYDGTYSKTADLLEPHATEWKHLSDLLRIDPLMAFPAAGGKVLLLDKPPRVWDPRTDVSEPLAGPNPMREGASVVSLDETHLLILGGTAQTKTPTLRFLVECALAGLWLLLGGFLTVRTIRKLDDAGIPYVCFGILVGSLPLVFIELVLEFFVNMRWGGM